jgi:hypothetical protein
MSTMPLDIQNRAGINPILRQIIGIKNVIEKVKITL